MSGSGSAQTPSERRLQKELMSIINDPPCGISIDTESNGGLRDLSVWLVKLKGAEGSLYAGEEFVLQFKFGPKYPFDSPQFLIDWLLNVRKVHIALTDFQEVSRFHYRIVRSNHNMTVVFVGETIPVHPHVYSNGHICLSILTDDWSPALSVMAVCLSIISMLSSCKERKRPPDNAFYVKTCSKNPKKTKWWYHDDQV